MAELFGRDVKTIGKHINNALREELDESTVANFATVQKEGWNSANGQTLFSNNTYYKVMQSIIIVSHSWER